MGGLFGVASWEDCISDLFYGTDYHWRRIGKCFATKSPRHQALVSWCLGGRFFIPKVVSYHTSFGASERRSHGRS